MYLLGRSIRDGKAPMRPSSMLLVNSILRCNDPIRNNLDSFRNIIDTQCNNAYLEPTGSVLGIKIIINDAEDRMVTLG